MNKVVNTYIMQSMLLIGLLTLLAIGYLWQREDSGTLVMPLSVVVVFQLVTSMAYALAWRAVASASTASLPTFYMAASGLRMFAGVALVMGFLFLASAKTVITFFIVTFLLYYFIILIYDTVYFVKAEKMIQQKGQIE
jgi:hypothetical protein